MSAFLATLIGSALGVVAGALVQLLVQQLQERAELRRRLEDYAKLTGAPTSIVDMLAMPGTADIAFKPSRLRGPLLRPADLS